MTAPTPSTDEQIVASLRDLTPGFGTEEEAADRIEALSAALAAVIAELDQARQMLADAPHAYGVRGYWCTASLEPAICTCWKTGL
jgi:hypothetical protein